MKRIVSYFHPKLPVYLVYMLQQVEYNPNLFLDWFCRFPNLSRVMHRQTLVATIKAKLLVLWGYYVYVIYFLGAILAARQNLLVGILSLLLLPLTVAGALYMLVYVAWYFVELPRRRRLFARANRHFKNHKAIKIAIAGSYGKTSMKELLMTVLSSEKRVAATPGNKNVSVSHARWADKLSGDEEVLLIEYGEGTPGDIAKFARMTHPDYAVLTGLAPNHLDQYKTLKAVEDDLLSIQRFVDDQKVFVNADDPAFSELKEFKQYDHNSALGWKISDTSVKYDGTRFTMKRGKLTMKLHSHLLGRHNVGPLAFAAAFAYELGVSKESIVSSIAETSPYEHRMQPRHMGGAWIIDDTYNGNLQGILAGLDLLKNLPAKRKIYVTPGLVDQGQETERVHIKIGRAIADANPDRVVLMQNSVTEFIKQGLKEHSYGGDLQIETDPLGFYTGVDHILASGDLIVMQNDWTDNYA